MVKSWEKVSARGKKMVYTLHDLQIDLVKDK